MDTALRFLALALVAGSTLPFLDPCMPVTGNQLLPLPGRYISNLNS